MKTFLSIFFTILLISCATTAPPVDDGNFSIRFFNDTEETMCYWLWWVDHNFENIPGPANMAGGELQPWQDRLLESRYPYGEWQIEWDMCPIRSPLTTIIRHVFIQSPKVVSTPNADFFE